MIQEPSHRCDRQKYRDNCQVNDERGQRYEDDAQHRTKQRHLVEVVGNERHRAEACDTRHAEQPHQPRHLGKHLVYWPPKCQEEEDCNERQLETDA